MYNQSQNNISKSVELNNQNLITNSNRNLSLNYLSNSTNSENQNMNYTNNTRFNCQDMSVQWNHFTNYFNNLPNTNDFYRNNNYHNSFRFIRNNQNYYNNQIHMNPYNLNFLNLSNNPKNTDDSDSDSNIDIDSDSDNSELINHDNREHDTQSLKINDNIKVDEKILENNNINQLTYDSKTTSKIKKNDKKQNYDLIPLESTFSVNSFKNFIDTLPNLVQKNKKIIDLKENISDNIEDNLNIIVDSFLDSQCFDQTKKFFDYIIKGNYNLKSKLILKNIFKEKDINSNNENVDDIIKYNNDIKKMLKDFKTQKKLWSSCSESIQNNESTQSSKNTKITQSNEITQSAKKINDNKKKEAKYKKKKIVVKFGGKIYDGKTSTSLNNNNEIEKINDYSILKDLYSQIDILKKEKEDLEIKNKIFESKKINDNIILINLYSEIDILKKEKEDLEIKNKIFETEKKNENKNLKNLNSQIDNLKKAKEKLENEIKVIKPKKIENKKLKERIRVYENDINKIELKLNNTLEQNKVFEEKVKKLQKFCDDFIGFK